MAKRTHVTSTGLVSGTVGGGVVHGYIVNSHSSGTIKLWDNQSADTEFVHDTFSFPAGSGVYKFPEPIQYQTALFATVGGTLNCELIFENR